MEGEVLFGEALHDELIGLGIDRLCFLMVLAEIGELGRRRAAPESDLDAAAAHMIEHAELLDHAQRVIERQRIDHRPEAQPFRALRDRGHEDAGARRHAEGRRVMLGDVVAEEAEPIIGLDDLEPRFVVVGKRQVRAVDVIEDTEFHLWLPGKD